MLFDIEFFPELSVQHFSFPTRFFAGCELEIFSTSTFAEYKVRAHDESSTVFSNMNFLLVLIVCGIASGVSAQKFNTNCTSLATAKAPTSPKLGTWYLVVKEKRAAEAAKCYNMNITTGAGKSLLVSTSLMVEKFSINNTFNANPNNNGTWDVTTTNGKEKLFGNRRFLNRPQQENLPPRF